MGFDSKAVTTPLSKFFLSLANVRKGTQLVLHQECPPGTSCGVTSALAPIFIPDHIFSSFQAAQPLTLESNISELVPAS